MAASFRVLLDRGLVYVRYSGLATVEDGMRAFADYMRHPDCRPGQKHLVDLTAVTETERDFARLMALQALKAEVFVGTPTETLIVYLAPGRAARDMAKIILRSWEGVHHIVARVQETEEGALDCLGLPEPRISDLLATTS